ncbi:collagen-binding domain-containing protein [Streptomyces sp. NPDC002577]
MKKIRWRPARAMGACAAILALALAAAPQQAVATAVMQQTLTIGNPLNGNNGFGVITEGDLVLGSTETEGTVAAGGNLAFGAGYNIALHGTGLFTAPGDAEPTALLVGGRVDFANTNPSGVLRILNNGYVKIGDLTGSDVLTQDSNGASVNTQVVVAGAAYSSAPRIELTTRQPAASVGPVSGLMDFASLFARFRERSTTLARCNNTVELLDGNGNPLADQSTVPPGSNIKISLATDRTNVLHLTGAMLNNIATLTFLNRPTLSGPLVVVVDTTAGGGSFSWHTPTLAGITGSDAPYLMWNYPDATTITIASGDTVEGTIYAPRTDLTDVVPSNIEGDVVASTFTAGPPIGGNAGEIHEFPFASDLECTTGPVEPTPEPSPTCPQPTATEPGLPTTPGSPGATTPGAPGTTTQPGTTPSATGPGATPPGTAPPGVPTTPKPTKTCPPQLAHTGSGSPLVFLAATAALLATAFGGVLVLWRRLRG